MNFYETQVGAVPTAYDHVRTWYAALEVQDRGGRATLRRCADVDTVAFVPAYHDLLGRFDSGGGQPASDPQRLARVALCAVHVKLDPKHPDLGGAHTFAAALARGDGGAPYSELRFRRLLESAEQQDFTTQLRRAIDSQKGAVSLRDVAAAAFDFNPKLRTRWAHDYYRNLPKKQETK